MSRIRRHLTFANVASGIALFVAISGGTAVALSGSNTVFTDDVANDTQPASGGNPAGGLVAADLRPSSVGQSEIAANGVGTADIASSIPTAHVTHSVADGISGFDTVAFDTERYDTRSMHDNATNNSRLTAPVKGIYAVTAQVEWSNVFANDIRFLGLRKNGTTDISVDEEPADPGANTQQVSTQVQLAANDYVEVVANTGAEAATVSKINQFSPEFSMTWLAPGP
jgi:hypothetical protein